MERPKLIDARQIVIGAGELLHIGRVIGASLIDIYGIGITVAEAGEEVIRADLISQQGVVVVILSEVQLVAVAATLVNGGIVVGANLAQA